MNAATITALASGLVAVITAVGALLHSIQTRGQVNTHAATGTPAHQSQPPSSQVSGGNSHA